MHLWRQVKKASNVNKENLKRKIKHYNKGENKEI